MTTTISLRNRLDRRLTKIVIPLLIAAAIIFNILAPIFALAWTDQPFLNFLLHPWLIVSDPNGLLDLESIGSEAETPLILSKIDDVPIFSSRDLFVQLGHKSAGEAVVVDLEPALSSSTSPLGLPVLLRPFPGPILFSFFWLPYGIGIVYLILGGVIYHLRGIKRAGGTFVTFCALVSILLGGFFDQHSFHFLTPLWVFVLPVLGASLVYLALVFPAETRLIRRRPWVGLVPYIAALILGTLNVSSIYFAAGPQMFLSLWPWNFGFIGLSVLLFLILLLDARFAAFSAQVRQQIGVIFWGSLLSFGPGAIWVTGRVLGIDLPFSWPVLIAVLSPLLIFPIVIIYATLRYRLLDLDLVFSRGIIYLLLVLLATAVYFAVVSLLGTLLQDNLLFRNPIILAVFILALVIFLEPARQRLQTIFNRRFLLEPFDARQMLQDYGRHLVSSPLDFDHIINSLIRQAGEALNPEYATVFLKDPTLDVFSIRQQRKVDGMEAVEVRFGQNDDLAQWLANSKNILQLSPSGAAPQEVTIAPEELARLHMLNIVLCVPLLGSDDLLGWLALGLKKSGHPYTSNDLAFLATLASQTTIALENAKFLEQANRRAAELEALQKITLDIQAEVEPDQLLASVVAQATQLLRAEGGMAFLLEPDNQTLKVVVSFNLDKDYTGYTLKKGDGIAGQVLKQGKPVVIDNYNHFSDRPKEFQEANFGAVMGVPLRWREKVRGVLYLVHRPQGLRFSQGDIWLMEFFATQSAIALDKSQLLQEARARASQLTTLIDVSTAISSTLDLDTALQRVMDRSVEILNAEAGSLLLMDRYGQKLIFEVALGPTGSDLLGESLPVGTGIVGTVAATGEPLIINDVAADPRWEISFDQATDFHTRDILCVPMIAHDQVVGVIEVINKKDGTHFKGEDRDLLLSFAAQAAIAIENAQIFTRTDQALAGRVQELQTLQMFDQELQISLDLAYVLDITLTHAMDSLGISMGLMGVIKSEDEEDGLYLLAQHGMPMEMARYKKDPWPLTKGIIGRVARTGELAWINDITVEPNYVPKNHRTRSMLVVPVLREDRVISVIDLESTDPDYFTSDDVSFVKVLSNHAAIAIENAQLFEQVKEANDAKTEFMSTASHELKIPMTSIKGYAKLLAMGAGGTLSDQQKEFVHIIVNSVDRMSQLVNDLLDVSRIEAGRIRLELRNVQIRDVIDEVLETIQTQIENKHLKLMVDLADNLPELRADYNRMVQIVTNLLSNAYKYTPEGGHITVTAKPYNSGIEGIAVTVKDTGYGISEEDQAKLFNTFFRSSDQNIRDEPGTGLGLSITKKMIESHGGELTFESQLGKGSAFTFTMPLICEIPPGVEVVER